jgi:ubiquinone biosynthesis accessory factor UbiJ
MKSAPPPFPSGVPEGTRPPAGFLQSLISSLQPPGGVVDEVQNRVVLFLNHVLIQEPQAQDRLRRQQGKPVRVQWGDFHLTLAATPAGLLERPSGESKPDLSVTLTQTNPLSLAQGVLAGDKPGVDIQGDVQLAAEVAWLVDNVRWDVEEDLSRVVGDATAHTLSRMASTAVKGVKSFVDRLPKGAAGSGSPAAPGASTAAANPASSAADSGPRSQDGPTT